MGVRDPRIDRYIDEAAPFARPVLRYLRETIHEACPEVEETVRWRFPHFDYKGVMCSMAAFKEHCTFGFWDGAAVVGDAVAGERAMGQFGRIVSLEDLPPRRTLTAYVRKAMALKDAGASKGGRAPRAKEDRPEPDLPDELAAEFRKRSNTRARKAFEAFSPSHRREYVEWIDEAKRPETRARRVAQTLAWLDEGKTRNWKYER